MIFCVILDTLLYLFLPPTVANELCPGRPVAVRRYKMETLLFSGIVEGVATLSQQSVRDSRDSALILHSVEAPSDIVSFTFCLLQIQIAVPYHILINFVRYSHSYARNSRLDDSKIVRMLNVLYTTFDVLTNSRKNLNI